VNAFEMIARCARRGTPSNGKYQDLTQEERDRLTDRSFEAVTALGEPSLPVGEEGRPGGRTFRRPGGGGGGGAGAPRGGDKGRAVHGDGGAARDEEAEPSSALAPDRERRRRAGAARDPAEAARGPRGLERRPPGEPGAGDPLEAFVVEGLLALTARLAVARL